MKTPYLVKLPWSILDAPAVCVEELEHVGHRVVYESVSAEGVDPSAYASVRTMTYKWGSVREGVTVNAVPVKGDAAKALEKLKRLCMTHSAQPEAVWLIHGILPFSKKELAVMAEKLKGKAAAAAKTKPVAGGGKLAETKPASARKGNNAGLEKARAAKAATKPAGSKEYKVLKKENGGREGSWTNAMIAAAQSATDSDAAAKALPKQYKDKKIDFGWLDKQGYIKLA